MSFNASRLTLYAIISALEIDLREAIELHLKHQKRIEEIFGVKLFEKIFLRLQKEQGESVGALALEELVQYLDFDETFQILNANRDCLTEELGDGIKRLTPHFQKLSPIRNRVMHARPLEFEDLSVCLDTVDYLRASKLLPWKAIDKTVAELKSNPAFVFGLSIPVITDDKISHNLPIPDFDETGFIGRRAAEQQLEKLLLGAHPVITVVGEGGQGKTALVLKMAYLLLDHEKPRFDAIVWSTAKTTQINAQEIIKIRGAISDSLGMLQSLQSEIVGQSQNDPIDDIIEYLQEFRILLILDNLETVKDSRIDGFLDRLPTGSKVLITSRIGLGEFERRLRLDPLEEHEAIRLLQALGTVRGLDLLKNAKRELLASYCRRMKNNPGFLKWFVSAVQTGRSPEQILDQPGLFLDYCMSNVYGYLAGDSRLLLAVFQVVAQQLSQAELSYLGEFEALALQRALYQLTATNMVRMGTVGSGSSAETKYSLSELARDYLAKHHPVETSIAGRLRWRFKELQEASNLIDQEAKVNRFSFFSIVRRSRGEVLVSKYLLDALSAVHKKELVPAFELIEKARSLSPQFFEVHRVAAIANAAAGNIQEAEDCYITALELENKSAPLHYWYGNFLARSLHDTARAVEQYALAEKLAPGEPQIVLERARCQLYLARFADARALLLPLEKERKLSVHMNRKVCDLALQIYLKESEFFFRQKDAVRAARHIGDMLVYLDTVASNLLDNHTSLTLRRSYTALDRCSAHVADVMLSRQIEMWKEKLARILSSLGVPLFEALLEKWSYGMIIKVTDGRYGFIRGDDDIEYYFNVKALRQGPADTESLISKRVRFELGVNAQGTCAVNVNDEAASDWAD